ncbi:hypothetical protein AAK913_11990 [Enterococcus faecium]|uniref:hypothetical protein n=1 Tax=Enterococcus faecium TaxID=1352 RepID=UPI001F3E7235|nr:hypothetical protein [Enterococcus faecium]EKZ0201703.1 hypothetical protein [Enterococcus faecalis]MCF8636720.1 hypothetical protein [Enterococcus faecium]HAQ5747095.1 hypothetical protein [Enterococcus faecium]
MKENGDKICKELAIYKFVGQLERVKKGAVPVHEVKSFPINTFLGAQKAIGNVKKGAVVWQHTNKWHSAITYVKKGYGFSYNRDMMDLIASGIDTVDKFEEKWYERNLGDIGYIPKAKSSRTSSSRKGQASYIVADFNKGENTFSTIEGSLQTNIPHRTHLISAQITGIENHKGLLIDFDGWLNINPLKSFENKVLELTKKQDIIWTVNIWQSKEGLNYQYIMYDSDWKLIKKNHWVDDRWSYIWYYDKEQEV